MQNDSQCDICELSNDVLIELLKLACSEMTNPTLNSKNNERFDFAYKNNIKYMRQNTTKNLLAMANHSLVLF